MGQSVDGWRDEDRLLVQTEDQLLDLPLPSLFGAHQIDNAALAVLAALALDHPLITEAAIAKGLTEIEWPARFQRLTAGPLADKARKAGTDLWLDGGHNPHAARALVTGLSALNARDGRQTAIICGLLANKDAAGFFNAFKPLAPDMFTIGFGADAAASPEDLARLATELGLKAKACHDVDQALDLALASQDPPPRIMICGSLYLAGEVLARAPETWPQ
jgi:dihydrofolate synthase/folylpolyglutamate synthase